MNSDFFLQYIRYFFVPIMLIVPLLCFGIMMRYLAARQQLIISRVLSPKAYTWTFSMIGTILHETSHMFFCVLFRHKIREFCLFTPKPIDGRAGFVNHSYNRKNIYHRIGNIFISMGPLLTGPFVIYIIWLLLCNPAESQHQQTIAINLNQQSSNPMIVFSPLFYMAKDTTIYILTETTSINSLTSISFYLFCFFSWCITTGLPLSKSDLKSIDREASIIVLGLLLINIVALFFNPVLIWLNEFLSYLFGALIPVFLLCLFIVLLFSIFLEVLYCLWKILR